MDPATAAAMVKGAGGQPKKGAVNGAGATAPREYDAFALRRAADAGDSRAACDLAICLEYGRGGVAKDLVEAAKWYIRAVNLPKPSTEALYNLARCYHGGFGVEVDLAAAADLFRRGAEMGDSEAMYMRGVVAQNGRGIPQDPVEAYSWFKRAADAGHPDAQCNVGYALAMGLGVAEDHVAAVSYYRKAADQGDATSMSNLAECYRDGTGVDRDVSASVLWFSRARKVGDSFAAADAAKEMILLAESLTADEVSAMGAGILRALLDGLGAPPPPGAEKPELVSLVMGWARGGLPAPPLSPEDNLTALRKKLAEMEERLVIAERERDARLLWGNGRV